jgi:hypothetical protein
LLAILTVGSVGQAQGIQVEKTVTVGKNVPDGGQLISATTWSDSGLGSVSWVGETVSFSSPFGSNPIVLSDLSGTLTFGSTSESPVTATVFPAGDLTNLTQQFTMADAFDGAWKSSGQWTLKIRDTKAGGIARLDSWKLVVEGNSSAAGTTMDLGNGGIVRVASSGTTGTINANVNTGSSGNTATMEVATDKTLNVMGTVSGSGRLVKNGAGTVAQYGVYNTYTGGTTINEGTLMIRADGDLGAAPGSYDANNIRLAGGSLLIGTSTTLNANRGITLANGGGGISVGQNQRMLVGSGITGSGTLTKTGTGELRLTSGGTATVSTIAIQQGTLLLGAANQISDSTSVALSGGTLNTAGNADRVGMLTVSANSSINGLVTSSGGGVANANDFLFSSVDLTGYATSGGGATLNLGGGYGNGATINIASSSYTTWTGYTQDNLNPSINTANNFASKIQFGGTGMKAQINFNASTGLTYVTAIPEPKVYVAMTMLVVLVGAAEYKRRKQAV